MINKIIEWLFFSRPFDDVRKNWYKVAYEQGRFDQSMEEFEKELKDREKDFYYD